MSDEIMSDHDTGIDVRFYQGCAYALPFVFAFWAAVISILVIIIGVLAGG